MSWSAEQEEMWQLYRAGKPPRPSGDQTPLQAFNFAVGGFMRVCDLEGVEPPPQEVVEQRFREEFGLPADEQRERDIRRLMSDFRLSREDAEFRAALESGEIDGDEIASDGE